MKQVIVIHGGDTFDTYEEYLAFLRSFTVDRSYFTKKGWKGGLAATLGEDFEVLLPELPNKWNAKYLEWEIWFKKLLPFIEDGAALVGHSLGGTFLAAYLARHRLPARPSAIVLIAAPFDMEGSGESLADFLIPDDLSLLAEFGDAVTLFHSEDDPVVPFAQLAKFTTRLPQAKAIIVKDRGHFNQTEFPELVELIRNA